MMFYRRTNYDLTKLNDLLGTETQTLVDLPHSIRRETHLEKQAALLADLLVTRCWALNTGFIIEENEKSFALLNDSSSSNCSEIYQEYAVLNILQMKLKTAKLQPFESFTIGPFAEQTEIQAITQLYTNILGLFNPENEANDWYTKQEAIEITILPKPDPK
jgi:hypothetical protein